MQKTTETPPLAPGARRTIEFELPVAEAGSHTVTAEIALPEDSVQRSVSNDRREMAFDVQ